MSFTEEELEKLRAELPRDASKQLGEQFGFKPNTIRQILTGRRKNIMVVKAALELAQKHQQEILNTKKSIVSL